MEARPVDRLQVEKPVDSESAAAPTVPTSPAQAWKVVGAVVRGVSHERMGLPCQDAQDYRVLPGGTLLVVLADGAGSAAFSDQGAREAVNEALHALTEGLQNGLPAEVEAWQNLLREAFSAARDSVLRLAETNVKEGVDPTPAADLPMMPVETVQDQAERISDEILSEEETSEEEPAAAVDETESGPDDLSAEKTAPVVVQPGREYATTLTCVVAAAGRLVVGQIGDGVVVAGEGEDLFTVTHLQRGEYANETHFITQADMLDHLVIEFIERPVSALAVMSDGLIRLALKMPAQEPHAPFFHPLFRATAAMQDEADVARQLSAFLGSERVNARTDDDKSLVLAVRANVPRISVEQALTGESTMEPDRRGGTAGSPGTSGSKGTLSSGQANEAERNASSLDWDQK